MLVTHNRLMGTPVLSLQTGTTLGFTRDPIIDPRQLVVVAFRCEGPNISGSAILHTVDIREFSNMGIIVDSAHALMPPDDLVRLKEVTDLGFTLLNKLVIDTHRRKLGKVESFSVDPEGFYIMKLNIRRPLMKSFLSANLLIDRSQIVEINNKRIVVEGADLPAQETTDAPQVMDNPFRRQRTAQTDTAAANNQEAIRGQ